MPVMIVLPIPLKSPPPELCWVICGGGTCVLCGGGCMGLDEVAELLGGGDLEPPLDPPLGIIYQS